MLKLLLTILDIVFGGASKEGSPKPEPKPEPKPIKEAKSDHKSEQTIDWNDPACKISKYFTVKDAIWLPRQSTRGSANGRSEAELNKDFSMDRRDQRVVGQTSSCPFNV